MLKQLYDRIKTTLGLNKHPGCQIVVTPEVAEFMNKPLEESHPNGLPVVGSAYPPGIQTRDDLIGFLEDQLKPKLVVDNSTLEKRQADTEPHLLNPANRRQLSAAWLNWCAKTHGVGYNKAWELGAKLMMDNEFAHGNMRKHVEILPWSPADPMTVNIKYHDPREPKPWLADE